MVFSGVVLNYYRDGNDSVAWHAVKDTIPGLKTEIASITLVKKGILISGIKNGEFLGLPKQRKKLP